MSLKFLKLMINKKDFIKMNIHMQGRNLPKITVTFVIYSLNQTLVINCYDIEIYQEISFRIVCI